MASFLEHDVEKTNTIDTADKELYLTFIDYRKAFDTVNHKKLFDVLLSMGVPRHFVELIAGLYSNQEAAVRWNEQLTEWFVYMTSTRQGCNISPTEFDLYAERITRKVDEENIEEDSEGELVIGGRRLTNLRYADDTTLLASK